MAHSIRLRGPWQLVASAQDSRRVRLPDDWPQLIASAADRGPLILERVFHRPTGLSPDSRVDLRLRLDIPVDVRLNDQPLVPGTSHDGLSFDLRDLLQPTNVLRLETVIDAARQIDQSVWDVWLELDD